MTTATPERQQMGRWTRNQRRMLAALLVVLLGAFLATTPTGRAYTRAFLLVSDLLSPSEQSVLHWVTGDPEVRDVRIPLEAGQGMEARYVAPASQHAEHGAIILVAGYPSNINDRQLNQVADTLARLGFAVLLPELPALSYGLLLSEDVDALVDAFEWLSARPNVDPERIAFSGFCVGSSLALLAAQDTRINRQVALVNVFGGYYDLRQLLRATTTHTASYNGRERAWMPARDTVALMAQNLLAHLPDDEQQAVQRAMRFSENPVSSNTASAWVLSILTTTEPAGVDELVANMPPQYATRFSALSPSGNMDRLSTQLFIMHDSTDPYIPTEESYDLAQAAGAYSAVVHEEFRLFKHVRPRPLWERLELVGEGVKLVLYVGRILTVLS